MDLIITILPVATKDVPISPRFTPYDFLSRCKFSTLTARQPMVEFYLLTFPRFPLRKKEHKSYFGKNRTHDFRTSRCAGYLLDHSGDEVTLGQQYNIGEKPTVILYTYINPHAGTPEKQRRQNSTSSNMVVIIYCYTPQDVASNSRSLVHVAEQAHPLI